LDIPVYKGTTTDVIKRLQAERYSTGISGQMLEPTHGTDVLVEIRSTPAITDTPFVFWMGLEMPNPMVVHPR
jgi:hypothetical protein